MKRRGFFLAEVLVSLGLVALALLSLMGVFTSIFRHTQQTSEATAAMHIARECLERCAVLGANAIPDGTVVFDGHHPDPVVGEFPPSPYPVHKVDGQEFTLVVRAEPGPEDFKAVTVRVKWGRSHGTSYQCYVLP